MTGKYADFLLSDKWKGFANKLKIKRGNHCEICGSDENLQVHHLVYSDDLMNEDELIVLCCNCHECMERHIKRFKTQALRSYTITKEIYKELMKSSLLDIYQNSIFKPASKSTISISQYYDVRDYLFKQIVQRFPEIEILNEYGYLHFLDELSPSISLEESGVIQWRNAEIKEAVNKDKYMKSAIQKRFRLSEKAYYKALK